MSTSHVPSESVDADEDEHAFNRTVHDTKSQGLGVVFIPSLDVEGERSCVAKELATKRRYSDTADNPAEAGWTEISHKQKVLQPSSILDPCFAMRRK
jgi:hypothetical protein